MSWDGQLSSSVVKMSGSENLFGFKNVEAQNYFFWVKIYSGPKIFFLLNNFLWQKCLGLKRFLRGSNIFFWQTNFWSPKMFWSQKVYGLKSFMVPKEIFGSNSLRVKNFLGPKILSSEIFALKLFWGLLR